MDRSSKPIDTIDDYILQFEGETQKTLQDIRKCIKEAAPEATEKISYQMPTFVLQGNLVHFAAYARHIGFYPSPSGIEAFKEELSIYKWAKGSVQFPIDKPIPFNLIRRIVKFRAEENIELAKSKVLKKKIKK